MMIRSLLILVLFIQLLPFANAQPDTIDAFMGGNSRDWSAERLKQSKEFVDTRIADRKKLRVEGTTPTLSREKIAGEYIADAYGKISIVDEAGSLKIHFEHTPDLDAVLSHWNYDVYELKWDHPEVLPWFTFGTVKFETDNNGSVLGISFDVPNDDFWFDELNAKKKK
jgi:hypothetical protein